MNSKANTELNLPQSKRSGAKKNSKMFIIATIVICVIALNLDLNLVRTQIAIIISESPMRIVKGFEKPSPKIRATICSCLGTRFSTLHRSPFASQTIAMKMVNILCMFLSFNVFTVVLLYLLPNTKPNIRILSRQAFAYRAVERSRWLCTSL